MGLEDPQTCKSYLRVRFPGSFLNNEQWLKESFDNSEKVSFLILDFLLHIHQIAHVNKLSYEIVQTKLKGVFTHFISSFPSLKTMIVLLDEQEYTPLGKIPTQQSRSDSLTMEERSSIVEGGVLENAEQSVIESIDKTFERHPDVLSGKKNPFAVFFSKYVRTRALRKDMMRLITNSMIDLIKEKRIPQGLRLYVDGISYSTYYAPSSSFFHEEHEKYGKSPSLDGQDKHKLMKKKSISSTSSVNAHLHMDEKYINVCRLDIQYDEEEDETHVNPIWFDKEEADKEIFGGYQGGIRRPFIGESDIKIPYYLLKIAGMIESRLRKDKEEEEASRNNEKETYNNYSASNFSIKYDVNVFVSSWDSDCIPICLLAMNNVYQLYSNIVPYDEEDSGENNDDKSMELVDKDKGNMPRDVTSTSRAIFRVLLDTKQGGSCWDLLSYKRGVSEGNDALKRSKKKSEFSLLHRRFVDVDEDQYLTDIIDISYMTKDVKDYFHVFYPLSRNPIETLCVFLMCGGTDFVRSLPGIGFGTIRYTFDAGGYLLISRAIKNSCSMVPCEKEEEKKESEGFLRLFLSIDESCIMGFYNLCIRFAIPHGSMGKVSGELVLRKKKLTSKMNKLKKVMKEIEEGNYNPSEKDKDLPIFESLDEVEEAINLMQKKRAYLDSFLWRSHYTFVKEMSKELETENNKKAEGDLVDYFGEISGMTDGEHEDWSDLHKSLRKAKEKNIKNTRETLIKKYQETQTLIKKLPEDRNKWTESQNKKVNSLIGKNSLQGKEAIAKLRNDITDPIQMSDEEVYNTRRSCITDIKGYSDIKPIVRTLIWNNIYWKFSPFFCLRYTKYLGSITENDDSLSNGKEGEIEKISFYGYKKEMIQDEKGKRKRTVVLSEKVSQAKTIRIKLK